jgi:hypothetical protein
MELYPTAVETVRIPVAAVADLVMPVEVAWVSRGNVPVDTTIWVPGSWSGEPGRSRVVEVVLAGRLVAPPPDGALWGSSRGRRQLFLRFTDGTNLPVRPVPGDITVY